MRTQRRGWMSAALALAPIALTATGQGAWSPDPEQALLGRMKAVFQVYEVSTSKRAISGEQALLGNISENGVRASASEGRNRSTADFALLGR